MHRYNYAGLADRFYVFFIKCCLDLIHKMGPKKSRKNVRKIVHLL